MIKELKYKQIVEQLPYLIDNVNYDISILANTSALLAQNLEGLNWVGFYLNKNETLLLGPFQGLVACTSIPFNKGVCGACARTNQTIIVNNVHEFPGHIACDSKSMSEICVPININNKFYGLLDIDSPHLNHFDEIDKLYLEKIVKILENKLKSIIF
jgi:GAF domain-containing protein